MVRGTYTVFIGGLHSATDGTWLDTAPSDLYFAHRRIVGTLVALLSL